MNRFYIVFYFVNVVYHAILAPFCFFKLTAKFTKFAWPRLMLFILKYFANIDYTMINKPQKNNGKGRILIGNHQSMLEIIILLKEMPNAIFVLKEDLLKIPVYGRFLKNLGMIATNREEGSFSELKRILFEMKNKLDMGTDIIIFPQGTRTPYEYQINQYPYKIGFFELYKNNYECVLFQVNTGKYLPKNKIITSGIAKMNFIGIVPDGLSKQEFKEFLIAKIENKI